MRNNSEVYWQPIDTMLSNSVCKYLMCCGHIIIPPVLAVATINSAKIVRCLFEVISLSIPSTADCMLTEPHLSVQQLALHPPACV